MGGLLVTVLVLYAAPKRGGGMGREKRRGTEGGGLYPELAAFRISEGLSPNVQEEVGRTVALMPIGLAQQELARRGLELDEKAIHRIAGELGEQILATRTDDLMKFRAGDLEAGSELAGKRIAVQIDGGRVRIRTGVKKSRVGKKRKRKKFRVEWREPKVLVMFELDEEGKMGPKTRAVIDGTLRGPDALIELVAFHLHRLGAAQATKVVFLGDGAKWIWNRLDWVIEKVGIDPKRVVQVLDWCHASHHISVALEDLKLAKSERQEHYVRLRKLLKRGQAATVIDELESLAEGLPDDRVVWREIRYLQRHLDAGRLSYPLFQYSKLPIGSGAIESTIRRVINLRMKGNGIYWREENAEAIFQLRAALLSGRWDDILTHTRERIARNRNTNWHWTPPEALDELNALDENDALETETQTKPSLARQAA